MKYFFYTLYSTLSKVKFLVVGLAVLLLSISFVSYDTISKLPKGDPDNGGLALPGGFEAVVVADSVGSARHLAVNQNGDIYVKLRSVTPKGGSVALRDIDNDGKADVIQHFGDYQDPGRYGTAMRIYNDYLYYSTAGVVFRNKLTPGKLIPESKTEVILTDDYKNKVHGSEHIAKPITFDNAGHMYVPFGAPGDVCQLENRVPGLAGQDPCPQLEEHGGVWQFDANKIGQLQSDGKKYATGIRSVVAMDWNKSDNNLYVLQHGRDNLVRTWPDLYNNWQSAVLPSEEFLRVKENSDAGWPYYYYDHRQGKKLLNPEYGGDGTKVGKGAEFEQPIIGFPGHWAPNDLHFYQGDQFPARYKNGAFIAFHGSTIRAPYPQAGYFVCFVPFKNGAPSGPWEVFADGFASVDTIVNTADAKARPMGIAMGPDGSLYITESVKGKIWRIMYKGDRNKFGKAQLAGMEKRKQRTNIKEPDIVKDNLEKKVLEAGEQAYKLYCGACHQGDGKGDGSRFPPLAGSERVIGDKRKLIEVVLKGMSGPLTVKGVDYNGVMPAHDFLKNEEIAQILTYIRKSFGNNASSIGVGEVLKVKSLQ
ncbi:c-type cytochrome [Dyadobacter sp. LHD-138]|uniref:c-type cytochrome n=1 Tax=Dyadobacter sp. LHD-138 TaxID=3071413 RepID=UPI0027DFF72A|nr:c-type cytochrome [Dyadobacter sp. LHD-138]MDQ6477124.1 PQQ-dependent sugar dehydrogenase [Dyadobacter sp. LHD-138]